MDQEKVRKKYDCISFKPTTIKRQIGGLVHKGSCILQRN